MEIIEKIEMYASMRKAEKCAIMPQTHFENAKKLSELRRLSGRESHSQKNVGWDKIAAYCKPALP